jgi:hypothetical protein
MAENLAPLEILTKNPSLLTTDSSDELKSALDSLKQLMAKREQGIDPGSLALSRGFFAPTKTGSFSESLGNVAESYLKAQPEMDKQAQENAMMRLQMGILGSNAKLAERAQQQFGNLLGLPSAPSSATTPTNATTPTTTPSTTGAMGATGATTSPATTQSPSAKNMTMNDVARFALANPNEKEKINLLTQMVKEGQDRYKIALNGTVFDTLDRNYVQGLVIPGQSPQKYPVPEIGGELTMLPWQYEQYQIARSNGQGGDYIKKLTSPNPMVTTEKIEKTPAQIEAEKYEPTDMSASALAARAKANEETAVLRAKGENDRYQSAINKGNEAPASIATLNTGLNLLKKPGINKVLAVFENGDFVSALGTLLDNGIGVPGFKVTGDQIREIMSKTGVDPKIINDAQLLTSVIAQVNFGFRSLAKGQGAISDFETKLFNSMGLSLKDSADTLQKKIEMMKARAEFERSVANKLEDSNMSHDKFKRSDNYLKLEQEYYDKLTNIINPTQATQQRQFNAKPSAVGNDLRSQLGLPPR